MRMRKSAWRGLCAIFGAAVAFLGMTMASATASAGEYAQFEDTGLNAAPGVRRLWDSITGLIKRFGNSVEADQIPEMAPIGLFLGNACYVGTGLLGSSRRDLLQLHTNTRNPIGDSRKRDRLNS